MADTLWAAVKIHLISTGSAASLRGSSSELGSARPPTTCRTRPTFGRCSSWALNGTRRVVHRRRVSEETLSSSSIRRRQAVQPRSSACRRCRDWEERADLRGPVLLAGRCCYAASSLDR